MGLGLFMARQVIERHGGSVTLESAPGVGRMSTHVCLWLGNAMKDGGFPPTGQRKAKSLGWGSGLYFHQSKIDGKVDELGEIIDFQFFHDIRSVRLDGAYAHK